MYKKILVALDMTGLSDSVFEQALQLASLTTDSELLLFHVLSGSENQSPPMPIPSAAEFPVFPTPNDQTLKSWQMAWDNYREEGRDFLAQHADIAAAQGVTVTFEQIDGDAGQLICKRAESWSADLIMVGRHGHHGLSEWLLGSISNYVLHHAPCPLLVVQ
ncbi:MAG: universal stress protein [Cyanobacteria bacterium P01_H01_bin.15]